MKFKITLFAMLLWAGFSYAGIVPVSTARTVAKNLYFEKASDFFKVTFEEISFSDEITISSNENEPAYYIFNVSGGKGFVIVSAENATIPVLGYSFEKNIDMNDLSPEFSSWTYNYKTQIENARKNNTQADLYTMNEWNYYLGSFTTKSFKSTLAVTPLLTTTWDQGCYYNGLCPSCVSCFSMCSKMPTGCVATAMAQIMKYHAYPTHGYSSHSYTSPTSGTLSANFGAATYAWASMPNNVTSANTSVATIMFHCGVAVEMNYTSSGSGAMTQDAESAFLKYFIYNALYDSRSYHTDAEWIALLKTDLDNNRPILYAGTGSDGTGGHAWVCDGYKGTNNDYFHFNFGWSGSGNGYFYITSITPSGEDFSYNQEAVINIYPSPATIPVANFTANKTNLNVNEFAVFTNTSTNNPLDFSWALTPNSGFSYISNTTSISKSPIIKFTSAGNYTVALTSTNSAGSDVETKSNYIHVGASGIESLNENDLNIYPNPTKGIVNISLGNFASKSIEITIYNYIGTVVKSIVVNNLADDKIALDLSDQAQGIYYISLKSENNIITRKITLVN